MIKENSPALSQALIAQISACASNKKLTQYCQNARTDEECMSVMSEINLTEYLHNHSEVERIFNETNPTDFVPYEA